MVKFISMKTILIGIGVVAVLLALFFTLPKEEKAPEIVSNDTSEAPSFVVPTLSVEDATKQAQSTASYEAILASYNNKEYVVVIDKAKIYGEDSYNAATPKINAYYLCVRSAFEIKDEETKTFCYEKALSFIGGLEEQDKESWVPVLQAGLEGKNYEEPVGTENDNF